MRARLATLLAVVATALSTTAARADPSPWTDNDPAAPPSRFAFGDYGFRGGAEYRANWAYVNPVALTSENDRKLDYVEQRLRLDGTFDYQDKIKITTSIDALDGVLWGDNGSFGGTPSSNAGLNLNARNPSVAVPCMTFQKGDIVDPNSYGYGLCPGNAITVRRLYGDVALPFGVLRIGRQAVNVGTGVVAADGDGRPNRFGFSRSGNQADRILFATKPLEALKKEGDRDITETKGLILALGYDRLVQDSVQLFGDDVHQAFVALRYLAPDFAGGRGKDGVAQVFFSHRWDQQYASRIYAMGARAQARLGDFYAGFDGAAILGHTREISTAYSLINNDPIVDQTVRQFGLRAAARYERPWWTAYFEFDYASGDADPRPRTPLTQFVFAEDSKVGLLLFDQVLKFQTWRSSSAANALLSRLGATTLPSEAVNTRGAFTNALAIFPQVDFHPHRYVLLRGGVLAAWAASPVNDPVQSLQRKLSIRPSDNLVNFVGGPPGTYYGTELDGRVRLSFLDHFHFDLEGAILFPGDALKDEDGRAARSVMVQGRTTYYF